MMPIDENVALMAVGLFVGAFLLVLAFFIFKKDGRLERYELWGIGVFSSGFCTVVVVILGLLDRISVAPTVSSGAGNSSTPLPSVLIAVVPIALTALTGVAIAYTRNALIDIREEKKRIDEALGLSAKLDTAKKEMEEKSWALNQQELHAKLLSEIARLAVFATRHRRDAIRLDRLIHLEDLFVGTDVDSKVEMLELLQRAPNLREELNTQHEDFIRELPQRFPGDEHLQAAVNLLIQTLNQDRRDRRGMSLAVRSAPIVQRG